MSNEPAEFIAVVALRRKPPSLPFWAPLTPVQRRFMTEWLAFLTSIAEERGVPASDMPAWRRLSDAEAPSHLVDDPASYACEGRAVAVGVTPTGG